MAERIQSQLRIRGPLLDQTFVVPEGTTVIGRLRSSDLQLNYPSVLRRHARLVAGESGCQIIELSGGQVEVNGLEIASEIPVALKPGDIIQIGPFRLVYEEETAGEETAVTEAILSEDDEPETDAAPAPPAAMGGGDMAPPPTSLLPPSVMAAPPPPPDYSSQPIPGLARHSVRFIDYLPRVYQTDFMSRFLAVFEALALPLHWNIENFDLYLDPNTAPEPFLNWMGSWYGVIFDDTWNEEMRRVFLAEAHEIFSRRGTEWALRRMLEIYTGRTPEIIDDDTQEAFTFTVRLPQRRRAVSDLLPGIEKIIEMAKPVHASYKLEFGKRADIDDILGKFQP